jgi:hypothetical protein
VVIDGPGVHAETSDEESLGGAHALGHDGGLEASVLKGHGNEVIDEAIEIVAGSRQPVMKPVPQYIVGAININLSGDERVKPRENRSVLVCIELGGRWSIEDISGYEQSNLRRLPERAAREPLLEYLLLDDMSERVADSLVHLISAGALGHKTARALALLRADAPMILKRLLEIVAKGKVPEIVHE